MHERPGAETIGVEELLGAYRPTHSTLFAGPSGGLLATGVRALLPAERGAAAWATLPERVRALLLANDADGPTTAVGAIPFDHHQPAHLYIPDAIRHSGPLRDGAVRREPDVSASAWQVRQEPRPEEYAAAVSRGVARFSGGELEKVVLARTARLRAPTPVDVPALVEALARGNPGGHTFAVNVPAPGPSPRTFLGTTPELLVRRSGTDVLASPHAGTAARSDDPEQDRANARSLLASAKERHEHEVVVRDVAQALRGFCRTLTVPPEPELVSTGTLWHLATPIEGRLASSATTSLHLACALHPTPAVCGTPTEIARRTVAELEPFDRGYYAGIVGWTDTNGDGDWLVAIRSAEVQDSRMRLFAGAGIVAESDPDAEVRETSAKFRTMLDAMGVDATL